MGQSRIGIIEEGRWESILELGRCFRWNDLSNVNCKEIFLVIENSGSVPEEYEAGGPFIKLKV